MEVLERWDALLAKVRTGCYLHQRSPRNIPLKGALQIEYLYDRDQCKCLESFGALDSWFYLILATCGYPQDHGLKALRGDIVAVYEGLITERPASE